MRAAQIKAARTKVLITPSQIAERLGIPLPRYRHLEKQCSDAAWAQYGEAIARILRTTTAALEDLQIPTELDDSTNTCDPQTAEEIAARLATHAANRRHELKLSIAQVARDVGVTRLTLAKWEAKFPLRTSTQRLERWAHALQVPAGWLTDTDAPSPSPSLPEPVKLRTDSHQTVSDEILDIAAWLAESNQRRRQADWSTLRPAAARNAEIFALRYGREGEARTLDCIGQRFNITRERTRQICATMLARTRGQQFATPVLASLIVDLQAHLPAPIAELESRFRDRLGPSQSLRGVYEFATEILATRTFEIRQNVTGHQLLRDEPIACRVGDDQSEIGRVLYDASCRMIRVSGAAQVQFVFGVCAQEGLTLPYPDYMKLVMTLPGFEWLEERTGWYWLGGFGPADNRALFVARKILAVSPRRVDVAEIVSALARGRRRHNVQKPDAFELEVDAPRDAILGVLRRSPGIEVLQHDDLKSSTRFHIEDELSATEIMFYKTLHERGGLASWSELKSALCDRGGIQPVTFHMTLHTSPILQAVDFGLYKLIGYSLCSDKAIESLSSWRERLGATRAMGAAYEVLGSHAEASEPISVVVRLGSSIYRGGYFDSPAALKPYLKMDQSYSVAGFPNPIRVWTSTQRHNKQLVRLQGMPQVFKSMGLRPGTQVTITLNPADRRFEVAPFTPE
ncbi:helix-turn-helix domain-containing protein [Aromatoleum evansii]|uniref:helix-turn-helix domain-containing protein n=1 Tax=Aromatoleum evansii TaxID=59406 RepID=UPI001B7CE9C3|nr:helix-turn-helix domain-containing protein [Aromatoleum evansii]